MTVGDCYGIAVAELRIAPSEFWTMTPRQFMHVLDRRNEMLQEKAELEKRADHRAAVVVCKLHNAWRGQSDPVLRPWDIYPWLEPEPQSDEEIFRTFKAYSERHNARFAEA